MEKGPNQQEETIGGRILMGNGRTSVGSGQTAVGTGRTSMGTWGAAAAAAVSAGLTVLARSAVKPRRAVTMLFAVSLAAVGASGAATGTAAQASTAAYSVIDLGTLSGNSNDTTEALAINGSGLIVGRSAIYKNGVYAYHAFLYSPGKMINLGALPSGDASQAFAIDKFGDVAGVSSTCKGCYEKEAFLDQQGR